MGELPEQSLRVSKLDEAETVVRLGKKMQAKPRAETVAKRSVAQGAQRRAGRADFTSKLVQGSTVYHPRLGLGKIEEIGRVGKFTRAVINFEQAGPKTMMLEYADLREAGQNETNDS